MTQYKRIAIGIAAALALHLLVLPWLAPGKHRPNESQTFQVRLVRTRSTGNVQPERADAAASERPGTVPARSRTAARGRPDVSAPALSAREETATTSAVSGSPPLSLVLKEPLSVPDSGTGARAEGATQTRRSPAQETAEQKATVERRIGSWVADAKSAQRLEVPDVDWREAATLLEQGFRPGSDILEHNAANTPAAPGRSQNLPPDGNSLNDDLIALPNEARGLESVSLGGAPRGNISLMNVAGLLLARSRHRLSTLVSVAHAEDGSISAVRLAAGSGNAAYDRLALNRARSLSRLRSPERGACRSVWVFETEFTSFPTNTVNSHVRLAALY